jgi:hypothetical protein
VPRGFLVRGELVEQLALALRSGGGASDDAAFLARVRKTFPPPSVPPPSVDGGAEASSLREQVRAGDLY